MDGSELERHLPPSIYPLVATWIQELAVPVYFARKRASRLGDFRVRPDGRGGEITLNSDLKPYQCLVTLIHELAHAWVWRTYKKRVKPHGQEWKSNFRRRLLLIAESEGLPFEFRNAARTHAQTPTSATARDPEFLRQIRLCDGDDGTVLDEIEIGVCFRFQNRRFVKLNTQRTRCRCRDLSSQVIYSISKSAYVERCVLSGSQATSH